MRAAPVKEWIALSTTAGSAPELVTDLGLALELVTASVLG